jgi:hypothetical protein
MVGASGSRSDRNEWAATRPECGCGGWPASLVQARYTAARKILVHGAKISVELNDL